MNNPPWRVLVLPGGTEVGLEINRALRDSKEVILYSAGTPTSSAADVRFARHYTMTSVHENGWIDELNALIETHKIDFVFPAHDDVVLALAERRNEICAAVVTSPLATCLLARSKKATYAALKSKVPVPKLISNFSNVQYPVFVKPDRGQGSQRARIINNADMLQHTLKHEDDLIVLEYLPGDEYTIDCFSDRVHGLLHIQPRKRVRTRAGISMHTIAEEKVGLREMAYAIAQNITFHGAWFFQARLNSQGVPTLLEIAPRISGAMALSRVLGVNFPLLSLYEHARIPINILATPFPIELNRSLDNHYCIELRYSSVYVDFDDTLVNSNGLINERIMRFLFQCINRNIPIILLTRHNGNLTARLDKLRISNLFDRIIHLSANEDKTDFILEADAIFIDDSFTERQKVARKGIATFDPSSVECLIDDRT